MTGVVIVVGLVLLVLLGLAVGLIGTEPPGSGRAWREIAEERRRNWEDVQWIRRQQATLDRCRDCPLRPDGPEGEPRG